MCRVKEVQERMVNRVSQQYLVLEPVGKQGSQYMVPMQNEAAMSKVSGLISEGSSGKRSLHHRRSTRFPGFRMRISASSPTGSSPAPEPGKRCCKRCIPSMPTGLPRKQPGDGCICVTKISSMTQRKSLPENWKPSWGSPVRRRLRFCGRASARNESKGC